MLKFSTIPYIPTSNKAPMETSSILISAFCFAAIAITACKQSDVIDLRSVREIHTSGKVILDSAYIEGVAEEPAIRIIGDNITVDFNGLKLLGSKNTNRPDKLKGVAVEVQGTNITIQHLKVAGYRTAIAAEYSNELQILDCDLSYNYRPRLIGETNLQKEGIDIALPESEQARRVDAAIHLTNCHFALISQLKVHQGHHAIYLDACRKVQILDSDIRFNSGIAIAFSDSDSNVVMNNRMDYNIRSHHQRSGVLFFDETSAANVFENNSMTHSKVFSNLDMNNDLFQRNAFLENDFTYTMDTFSQAVLELLKNESLQNSLDNQIEKGVNLKNPMQGKQFILINEWGPYNFEYPTIWLREATDRKYTFALLGPEGNWRVTEAEGFEHGSLKSGTFPNSLTAERSTDNRPSSITLEFIGSAFTDQFGRRNSKGNPYLFSYDTRKSTKNDQVK